MQREWRYQSGDGARIFGGVLVIAVGVIFLLNNLGILEARDIFRLWFWPLVIIAFGVIQLVCGRRRR